MAVGNEYKIEIYNVLGEKVGSWQQAVSKKETIIDVSDKAGGVYFLNIKTENELFNCRLGSRRVPTGFEIVCQRRYNLRDRVSLYPC